MADFKQATIWKQEGKRPVISDTWELSDDYQCVNDIEGHMGRPVENKDIHSNRWEIYAGPILMWYGYMATKSNKKWFGDFSMGVEKKCIVDFNKEMRDCIMYPHQHTLIEGRDNKQGEQIVTEPMVYTMGGEIELFFKVEYKDEIIYEDKVTFIVTETRTIKSECAHMANLMDYALTRISE